MSGEIVISVTEQIAAIVAAIAVVVIAVLFYTLHKREKAMCSTEIRQKIVNGDDWKDMVPNAVYEYIIANGLTEKVINLLKK